MEEVESIIKKMCQALNIENERQLALYFEINQNVITGWKTRKNVPLKYVKEVSQKTNIPLDTFFTKDTSIASKSPMKKIPFYKSFKASAGFGAINGDVEEPEYIIMPGHFLPDASCQTEAIECSGDSMSPAINNGDTMFIDRADTEIRDGEIYVIRCFEELFVKRLFKMPGKIMARSDNATAGYSEFPLDLSNSQVLGRVLYRMERV